MRGGHISACIKKKQSGGQTRQDQRQQNWNPAENGGEKTVFAKQVIEIRELREENGNQSNKQRATLGNEEQEEIEKRESVPAFSRKTPSSGFFLWPHIIRRHSVKHTSRTTVVQNSHVSRRK